MQIRAAMMLVVMIGLTASRQAMAFAPVPVPAESQCPRDAEPIPKALAAWSERTPLAFATAGRGPTIAIGHAYDVGLHPDAKLRLPNLPGPIADRVGSGGVASFTVKTAGAYQVALGSGVWVDVVRDGKALESTAHGHGPTCSGIGKMISFELTPGSYTLTLDGAESDRTSLLIIPVG